MYTRLLSNLSILSVPDEGYSRNALNLISTFLLHSSMNVWRNSVDFVLHYDDNDLALKPRVNGCIFFYFFILVLEGAN